MTRRMLQSDDALLLVVDIQEKFIPVIHLGQRVVEKTHIMIEAASHLGLPVIVSEQYPKGLGHTVPELTRALPDNAIVLDKTAFGCLGDEGITKTVHTQERRQVMVCGIEGHVCVNQTVHQLLEAGYEAHLIQDAISSREAANLQIGLDKMHQSGAIPCCTEMALFELMHHSLHPQFKSLQALIK